MKYDRISCGGVVIKKENNETKILLLHRFKSPKWEYDSWHLPKGMKKAGESDEETALREVVEETGYEVQRVRRLVSLESTYDDNKQKITHYYLFNPIKNLETHDTEHDEVVWKPISEAKQLLAQFPLWEKEEEVLNYL